MVENDASAEHTAMERVTVDARGLSCPEPVIMTMEAMKSAGRETSLECCGHRHLPQQCPAGSPAAGLGGRLH